MSDQKTAQQITREWQAIELSRTGGRMPIIEALLSRVGDAPQGDRRLVEAIDMLYGTLLSYHEEMGVLIDALRVQAEAEVTWDAAVARLMQGGNLVLAARCEDTAGLSAVVETVAERISTGYLEEHDETPLWGVWYRVARAQAGEEGKGGEVQ